MRKTRTEKMLGAALLAVAVAMVLVIMAGIAMSIWAIGRPLDESVGRPNAVVAPAEKRYTPDLYSGGDSRAVAPFVMEYEI